MLTIAILAGGTSSERDISLQSAKEVYKNLDLKKYKISFFDFPKEKQKFLEQYQRFELVLPIFHGLGGEDGTIQGFLKTLGIRYAFSGIAAHALAMNKYHTKIICAAAGIPVPEGVVIHKDDALPNTTLPVMVKPLHGGSSVGITLAHTEKELRENVTKAFFYESEVLLESHIQGDEYTVAILGNERPVALPVVAIHSSHEFFDREVKYADALAQEICPAPISEDLTNKLQAYAIQAHKTIGCRGISRSDFIVDAQGTMYFLELNTIPGLTAQSLFPKAAYVAGYSFATLLDKIIGLAQKE